MHAQVLRLSRHSPSKIHARILVNEATRAVDLLAQATGLPKARVKDCMTKGGVWQRLPHAKPHRVRRATATVQAGMILEIWYDATLLQRTPPALTPVGRGPQWSVWAKPPGIPTHGSPWGDHLALTRITAAALGINQELHPVYRLDTAASGLVLLAHTTQAMAAFCRQMRQGTLTKEYTAVLQGVAPWQERIVTCPIGEQPAQSRFCVIAKDTRRTWVRVHLATGRRHQIRRHAAQELQMPVVGDIAFGGPPFPHLLLACTRLTFSCPLCGAPVLLDVEPVGWPCPATTMAAKR